MTSAPRLLLCLLCLFAAILLSGCGTLSRDLAKAIPEGSWKEVNATVTGKFSATKVQATDVVKSGDTLTAGDLHIRHSNVWIPLIEIDATGYAKPPAKP